MNSSKSPVVTEFEYIEPLCTVFESGRTTIISLAPWANRTLDRLGDIDIVGPLLSAYRIAMQCVHDRIMPGLFLAIAGRKEHENVAIDGITLQNCLKGFAVNLYVFHRDGLGAGNG